MKENGSFPTPPVPFLDSLKVFLRIDFPGGLHEDCRVTPKRIEFRRQNLPFDPQTLSGTGRGKSLAREGCLSRVRRYVWDLQRRTPLRARELERRRSPRIPCDLAIHVLEPCKCELRARNLSSGGALCISPREFPAGLTIRCMFALRRQGTVRDSLILNARILRSGSLTSDPGKSLLALEFIDLTSSALEALKQVIEALKPTHKP